ncbi:LacI family DNA-binding transcriptional regulator [Candidatus Calescamantes bacterium]|nr:LacI family DNA-binding transcriptional regulator [Candidatus Calescamantes bacterium]
MLRSHRKIGETSVRNLLTSESLNLIILVMSKRESNNLVKRFKNPSLKEIARFCGVSISTVSYALNNNPKISEKTRKLILETAEKLNYIPHYVARGLVKGKTESIGLSIGDIINPCYIHIAERMVYWAKEKGYSVFLSFNALSPEPAEREKDLRIFLSRKVDGIIVGPIYKEHNLELLWQLKNSRIPFVAFGDVPFEDVNKVLINTRKASYLAIRHLIEEGHKKIGYLCLPPHDVERLTGYKDALLEFSLPFKEEWVIKGWGRIKEGYEKMKKVVENLPELPTAFVCHNDLSALGAIRALKERGFSIPEDIALVGYDNIEDGIYSTPSLTTIDIKGEELARSVVELLFESIENPSQPARSILIEPHLIIRESSLSNKDLKKKGGD